MKVNRKLYRQRKRNAPGTPPGTITPDAAAVPSTISVMAYGPENYTEAVLPSAEAIRDYIGKWPVVWINVDGLADVAAIKTIGEIFNLHPLALEDTVNVHQRPKTEDYDDYLFTVVRMVNETPNHELDLEQIAMFLGPNYVLSFQERPGDCWNPIRDRIRRSSNKRLRNSGPDYLSYALLDSMIDGYFPLMEKFGDQIDTLEDAILEKPSKDSMVHIQGIRRTLYAVRHVVWPLREAVSELTAHEDLVKPETRIFLRDCQDHVIQLLDIVESFRERVSGLMDIYLSSLSNRMNEVMKVLAIITTIFMPLSFIAGVYGMNFDNMPELRHPNGYFSTLIVMGAIAIAMIIYFYYVGWLTKDDVHTAVGQKKHNQ